jgi:50S ribosomal protein L16 3-hydroxylase
MSRPMQLRSDQWDHFISDYWGKKPACFPGVFPGALLTEAELLAALRLCGERMRAVPSGALPGSDKREISYFAGDSPDVEMEKVDPFPTTGESRLLDYYQRVRALVGNDYILVGMDMQTYSWVLWERILGFLRPLMTRNGQPIHVTKCDSFIGKYSYTPVGVHYDSADVFTFVIHGRKKLHLWTPEYVKDHPDLPGASRERYSPHLKHAITIEAGENDLLYWPNTYWHTAENDDFSATVTVMLEQYDYLQPKLPSVPGWVIDRLADRVRSSSHQTSETSTETTSLAAIRGALDRFIAAQRGPEFEDYLWKRWLERTSKLSFNEDPPESPPTKINGDDRFTANECVALEWVRLNSGKLCCAANGRSFELDYNDGVVALLERLASGEPWTLSDLARDFGRPGFDDAQIRQLVQECARLRVIVPEVAK